MWFELQKYPYVPICVQNYIFTGYFFDQLASKHAISSILSMLVQLHWISNNFS